VLSPFVRFHRVYQLVHDVDLVITLITSIRYSRIRNESEDKAKAGQPEVDNEFPIGHPKVDKSDRL
jgi:hypothetical protein